MHAQSTFKAFFHSELVASMAVKQQHNEGEPIDFTHNPAQSQGAGLKNISQQDVGHETCCHPSQWKASAKRGNGGGT